MISYFEHPWGAGPCGTSGTGLAIVAKIINEPRNTVLATMTIRKEGEQVFVGEMPIRVRRGYCGGQGANRQDNIIKNQIPDSFLKPLA
jgi:hypothetical protein